MKHTNTFIGNLAIFGEASLWGLFPVITTISFSHVSPVTSLLITILFAALFLGLWLLASGRWRELLIKAAWPDILAAAFFLAVLYYGFYFLGLAHTTPNNAAIVALLEVLFSYLLFNIWRKEYFSTNSILGALLMVIGAAIILLPKVSTVHSGDFLVMAAATSAPFGNLFQQRARKKISSLTLIFARYFLALPFLFLLNYFFGGPPNWSQIYMALPALAVTGCALLGLAKIFWIEGIHRIPVTHAVALSSISVLFTLAFSYIFLHLPITLSQLLAGIPIFIGVLLLTRKQTAAMPIKI